MHVQNRRQLASRQTGEQPNHPQSQPLRTGDADLCAHPLRDFLETVDDTPEQLHEGEHIGQHRRLIPIDDGLRHMF
jgi:hypothetical protein